MGYRKLYIKTYGCQMNVYDSLRMEELLTPLGFESIDNYDEADVVLLNTCHIREKAAEKVYSELGRINVVKKNKNQDMIIGVAGCVGQAEGEQITKRAPYVDFVIGPQSYHELPKIIRSHDGAKKQKSIFLDFIEEKKFDLLPVHSDAKGPAAFLSVQEGCDKFCSFCVVPYTRGAEFSRPVSDILKEAVNMVNSGAKEVTLLGQNVNGYHGFDEKGNKSNLGKLIKDIAKIDGLERIRYTTSHPLDMHDDLYEAHATEKKLMPFLHLPVQSGSDAILKAMNRKHGAEQYLDAIKKLKAARPDMAFSSDFIVGFPGETEEDFLATMELIGKVNYAQCYSFKYSPRPGTPAALNKNQVPEADKSSRLTRLQNLLSSQQHAFNLKFEGQVVDVLFDRKGKGNQVIGRSPYLQSVWIEGDFAELYGHILPVKILHCGPHSMKGALVS